jgi:hypothetical protein
LIPAAIILSSRSRSPLGRHDARTDFARFAGRVVNRVRTHHQPAGGAGTLPQRAFNAATDIVIE